jgi:hypothetical protein
MSVQDDKAADRDEDQREAEGSDQKGSDQEGSDQKDSDQKDSDQKDSEQDDDQRRTEKPEVGEEQKEKAAEMMKAYKDQPTLVLPGSGGMVSGTAVNEWLDEEGNPQWHEVDDARAEGGSDQKADAEGKDAGKDEGKDDKARQEQIEKDKALNEELKKVAAEENKGEKK